LRISPENRLRIRRALLALGAHVPGNAIKQARRFVGLLDIGQWMREQSCYPVTALSNRNEIFDLIANEVGCARVLYLEFGVYKGDSIRYWSRLLRNPDSVLHGFDSFEGLPETWGTGHPKGRFSTNGEVPDVSDPRVRFFKGWFNETLPRYSFPEHEKLVINMDADLYTSTKYVLASVARQIEVGAWLYFDEFSDWQHEFRAFREFVRDSGMRFQAVAQCNSFYNIVFRRIA
jgi:O-methyltransferase